MLIMCPLERPEVCKRFIVRSERVSVIDTLSHMSQTELACMNFRAAAFTAIGCIYLKDTLGDLNVGAIASGR